MGDGSALTRLRNGLLAAAAPPGSPAPTAQPLRVTPHQLRHTYATTLANAGMSLQALMALARARHRRDDAALRHPRLTHPARRLRRSDGQDAPPAHPHPSRPARSLPDKVDWLRSEMLKTRVAHGYCSRHLAADACPYANICETCDNYIPAPEFAPALTDQLADIQDPPEPTPSNAAGPAKPARHDRVVESPHGPPRPHSTR